jgi:hypothetical protein
LRFGLVSFWLARGILCAFAFLLGASLLHAAPPSVTFLFPAGAQQGTTVEVTAGGTFERWPVQAWTDRKGVTVKASPDKGKLSITVAADTEPGLCWIRLYDEEGASSLRPFLVGTLPEILEQEPNNDVQKPQVLDASTVVVNGRLGQPNDVDCFAVKLHKGQTLVASIEANRVLGSPIDAILQLVSADGFVLEENNDTHDLDPQIVFTVPKDGTYIVRAFAFPATPDSGIRFTGSDASIYRLTLTTGGFADHPFPLAVSRAIPETVELHGWNIPDAAKRLSVEREGPDLLSLWHPQVGNTTTLRLEPHAAAIRAEMNDRQHPQTLDLPVTVSGRMRPGAGDFYQFQAKKGEKLLFQVESRALGYPLDAVLRLLDDTGKVLTQVDDPPGNREGVRDPELSFTVPADGRFLLEVRDLHSGGGFRYVYRLRAILAQPDYELTVAADRFVLTPGKPLDIPLTIQRRNGFDREIDITATGLPEGVTASSVKSLPSGNSAGAVMLRLTASSGPTSGLFQIKAQAMGEPRYERASRASLAGVNASTHNLWLTVLKPPAEPEKTSPKKEPQP